MPLFFALTLLIFSGKLTSASTLTLFPFLLLEAIEPKTLVAANDDAPSAAKPKTPLTPNPETAVAETPEVRKDCVYSPFTPYVNTQAVPCSSPEAEQSPLVY